MLFPYPKYLWRPLYTSLEQKYRLNISYLKYTEPERFQFKIFFQVLEHLYIKDEVYLKPNLNIESFIFHTDLKHGVKK